MKTDSANQHPARHGIRSTLIGIVINAILALTKGISGVLGNSYALIADAIESASDVLTSLIVLIGLNIASKPPDEDHPYGHGKAEPLAALFVSITLIAASCVIAVHSVWEIKLPHHAPAPFTLIVLTLVIIVKEGLFRYVFDIGEQVNSVVLRTDAWHHRSDAITSSAAFAGISIALIGGKGYESADDWAALFASFIIAYNGYNLFKPALAEVMDAAPPSEINRKVRDIALNVKDVAAIDKCFVRKMGFDYYVDIHVMVAGDLPVRIGHQIGHVVKDALLASDLHIADVLVHIEPV